MIIEFVLLVLVTVFIIVIAPKRRINRWCGVCIGILVCGSATWVLKIHSIPYLVEHHPQYQMLIGLMSSLHIFLSIFVYTQGPICFSAFFLVSVGRLKERISIAKFFLLMNIPSIVINLIYKPVDWNYNLEHSVTMWGMYHWLYIPVIFCIIFYLRALRDKKNHYLWSERFLGMIMILISAYAMMVFYTFRMFLMTNFFLHFQPYITWLFVGMFLCVLVWQGAAGIKINLELSELDSSIRTTDFNILFINHAIKGEINKIKSSTKLIEEDIKSDSNQVYCGIIGSSCDKLLETLDGMKNQLQEIAICYEQVDVGRIIKQVIMGYEDIMIKKQGIIKADVLAGQTLLSDRNHLYNVVDNIVKNAVEALTEPRGFVKVHLEESTRGYVISIQDDGCGMSTTQLKEIRKPFVSTKQVSGNYGLGMTYCYRVIKKLKGHIEIESKPNVGTIVRVFLRK